MNLSNPLHILIIEDNADLAKNIARFFEPLGYILDFSYNGKQGLSQATSQSYDVIILDLTLPGMDGLQVCEAIRQTSNQYTPIIMLTARDSLSDKLTGFQHGADDYLTKPFALEELHMRCQALAKRQQFHTTKVIELGELIIDKQRQCVTRAGQVLNLNAMSYRILLILAEAYPQVVTRSELIQKLWGDEPTESDAIRSHIYQLRQSVDKPFEQPIIKTLHGVGFTLSIEH